MIFEKGVGPQISQTLSLQRLNISICVYMKWFRWIRLGVGGRWCYCSLFHFAFFCHSIFIAFLFQGVVYTKNFQMCNTLMGLLMQIGTVFYNVQIFFCENFSDSQSSNFQFSMHWICFFSIKHSHQGTNSMLWMVEVWLSTFFLQWQ